MNRLGVGRSDMLERFIPSTQENIEGGSGSSERWVGIQREATRGGGFPALDATHRK